MKVEKMEKFFKKRVEGYENQMLNNVEGCKEGYLELAKMIPIRCENLLDLGCGTGLELKEIFKQFPDLKVTAIDLTSAMLKKLKEKYNDKNLHLICGDYFKIDFGQNLYDCCISFQTMHHFKPKNKIELYKKIHSSLTHNGIYIEGDYMVKDQLEEDFYFSELDRIRKEENIPEEEFIHYDIPCTIENQIKIFKIAGFKESKKIWQKGNTVIILNSK